MAADPVINISSDLAVDAGYRWWGPAVTCESGQRARRALNIAALWLGRDLDRSAGDGPAS